MFKGQKVLGLVPARAGSRRLPGKNLINLADKPLLSWTLIAGLGSDIVDKVILSTDDQEIGNVGSQFRVGEVLARPTSLANDDSSMTMVIRHVLQVLQERDENYGHIILLQPTSPLRTSRHIDEAFTLIERTNAVGAVSVNQTEHPTEWMGKIDSNGSLDSFIQQTELDKQSQMFSTSYQVNGAIYIVPVEQFLEENTLFLSTGMVAYVMQRVDSVDIDDEYDLRLAEWLMGQRDKEQPLD